MTDTDLPAPATSWEETTDEQNGCRIYQRGRHRDGTFIRVYVPNRAADPSQPLRAILYLHGFALCPPAFYDAHMRQLAQQGWIVFFPDFQYSTYREDPLSGAVRARGTARTPQPKPKWGRTTRRLLLRGREARLDLSDLPEELGLLPREGERALASAAPPSGLPELKVKDLRRVLLPWLLIQLVLAVIGWFRRTYARNLGELIGTVLLSLAYSPKVWLHHAVDLANKAWDDLADLPPYAHWHSSPVTMYSFGHSLGGLLSLSLPSLKAGATDSTALDRFQPQVILACDPATSTEMGIPGFAIALLKLFNAPFTADPLDIRETGQQLQIPVTILHGLDDTIVPPQDWAVQGGKGGFDFIASHDKALYFASSNRECNPDLVAFHNQAVTSTQTFDDALFESFGGVKHHPNAYNTHWIWPALGVLFAPDQPVSPPDLLQSFKERHIKLPFAVSSDPPPPRRRPWLWLLAVAGVAVGGAVLWRYAGA